jgi:hypothetical protein
MYYYQELNKTWHKLRKIHRDQIEKSMSNGTPEFDIPKRKNFKEKSKRIKKIQTGKEKISSVMQTA